MIDNNETSLNSYDITVRPGLFNSGKGDPVTTAPLIKRNRRKTNKELMSSIVTDEYTSMIYKGVLVFLSSRHCSYVDVKNLLIVFFGRTFRGTSKERRDSLAAWFVSHSEIRLGHVMRALHNYVKHQSQSDDVEKFQEDLIIAKVRSIRKIKRRPEASSEIRSAFVDAARVGYTTGMRLLVDITDDFILLRSFRHDPSDDFWKVTTSTPLYEACCSAAVAAAQSGVHESITYLNDIKFAWNADTLITCLTCATMKPDPDTVATVLQITPSHLAFSASFLKRLLNRLKIKLSGRCIAPSNPARGVVDHLKRAVETSDD
jgi:hypothetical protein